MNTTTKPQTMNTHSATSTATGTTYTFNAKRDWTGSFAVILTDPRGEGIYSRHGKREAAVKAAATLRKVAHFSDVHVVAIEAA